MPKAIGPLGAHTSTQGGLYHALEEGRDIGATTIQFFTSNQRQWKGRILEEELISKFKETHASSGLTTLMSHASYLVNLGSPNLAVREKSIVAFGEEIARCKALGVTYLNFHPGAALKEPREECIAHIIAQLRSYAPIFEAGSELCLLLEATAGQGSVVGSAFEELGTILHAVRDVVPIGVCIDTCHIFAAGYDIRTPAGWDETLTTFDAQVGLPYLKALHLNDSVHGLGSRKDRHAPLGAGEIGIESFIYLMQNPLTRLLPKYLETPGGPTLWREELKLLQKVG